MSQPRICPVCGYQLLDNENVCIICGKKFDSQSSVENHNTYNNDNTGTYVSSTPSSRYKSETVRTYSSTREQGQYGSAINKQYSTTQDQTFNTQTAKKKMNPILKVILIVFGLQFILPFVFGIIFVIYALISVNNMQDQLDNLVNANVETIEIEELDISKNDCTKITPLGNDIGTLYMSDNNDLCLEFQVEDSEATAFLSKEFWNIKSTFYDSSFLSSDEDYYLRIKLRSGNYANELDVIDYDDSEELDFSFDLDRLEDIELGNDTFKTYYSQGVYFFVCEVDSDSYLVCETARYDDTDDLEDIFPLAAVKTY